MDWFSWRRSRLGFLRVLKQPARNVERIWKNALKWTRYLISIFAESFDSYEHILATSLEKRKANFPRLYSWSSLYCHYGISNLSLHHQNVSPRNSEIYVRCFYWYRAETEIWTQQWQGQGKLMETMLLRYQPLVTSNSRTALKSTLREKYPNTELFLVRIFLYSDWIRRITK